MKRLKAWLAERDISQGDFGEGIGVKQPTVSDWLNGAMTPSPQKLLKISKRTGIPLAELVEDCAANAKKRDAHRQSAA